MMCTSGMPPPGAGASKNWRCLPVRPLSQLSDGSCAKAVDATNASVVVMSVRRRGWDMRLSPVTVALLVSRDVAHPLRKFYFKTGHLVRRFLLAAAILAP